MSDDAARAVLLRLFQEAIAPVLPSHCVPPHLPPLPRGRTVVVGFGKASAAMAQAVEAHWPKDAPLAGLVVTRYGHGVSCERIEVREAGHPVPDAAGLETARRIVALAQGLSADDLMLALVSGGGSSLFFLPAPGISLADKQSVTRALLRSGARISEMNCVRTHLSSVKGGRLALAASPARVLSLIISDVPGDDPAVVASGPTSPDPTTREEAQAILARYGIEIPENVRRWLDDPASESVKPDNPAFARAGNRIIAKAADALAAAAVAVRAAGYTPLVLGDDIEGEAREVAKVQAALALACRKGDGPLKPPCALISGGETTVTVKGPGRGGRNAEFLLALALALDGAPGISAIACDTDGIDGSEDNAGAMILPDTIKRAASLEIDTEAALAGNDSYGVFERLGDLVVTGPTRTNVNDFRVILIDPAA